jgi:peptidyl-dipeptidase Dcp
MLKHIIVSAVAVLTLSHFSTNTMAQSNPLLQKSNLQYQAPRFDLIKDEHFKPAFDAALASHDQEIDAIANNKAKATFANTIIALETSGADLTRATTIFGNLTGANTNPTLQKVEEEYAAIFSAHNDKIYLNSKIYNRIKSVSPKTLKGEELRLRNYYLQQFELAGANLSEANKEKMKKLNEEIAVLQTAFTSKLLEARKKAAVIFDTEAELDGLSADEIAAAKDRAKAAGKEGKYLLTILNTTQQPLLSSMKNRASREKFFNASWRRAENNDDADTRSTIEKLAKLRLQKAQLMGKKSFAEWRLQDQMAGVPKRAMDLLAQIAKPAAARAKQEAADIQKVIDQQGGGFKLEPWDWTYYAEQVRKEKYDLNEAEIKPYFEVRTVLEKGVFYAAKEGYGLTFKERKDLPVYHPDVVAYEVFDRDGSSLAIYYLDFYTRDSKSGGAWMNNFVSQSHYLKQKPVITNVFNFAKPSEGKPSLISFDDVTTMFHEFGHSIHGLFANQKFPMLSGTATPRDFVEYPSQINEHFALDPAVLKNYAVHYQTGKPIPQELVNKLMKASTFNAGYDITELLAAATLDLAWHSIQNENEVKPVLEFEKEALNKYGLLLKEVPTRYHTPYFAHIWGGGYSAGYYAYTWSKTLDYNCYDWFMKNGGMTRANCDKFRKYILSVGNTVDLNTAFKQLVGKEMQVEPYLRNAGLK